MKNRNLDNIDDWATPKNLYERLHNEFDFDFDPCPLHSSFDGLTIEWGERNYINPPYSRKLKDMFVKKAIEESKKGKLCVLLLPVSTSTILFHKHIKPNAKEIRFLEGRVRFLGVNTKGEYVTTKAGMHDSMIVVFDGRCKINLLNKPAVINSVCYHGGFKKATKSLHTYSTSSVNSSLVPNERLMFPIIPNFPSFVRYKVPTSIVICSLLNFTHFIVLNFKQNYKLVLSYPNFLPKF